MIININRSFLLLLISQLVTCKVFAQKPVIDSSLYGQWVAGPGIGEISNDGNYASYFTSFELVIQDLHKGWQMKFRNIYDRAFSPDNRLFVFKTPGDSLGVVKLEEQTVA